jgi:proteasome lid subunit RPN8/RPN11
LSPGLAARLREIAAAEWPREACGFLLARAGRVVAVRAARNVALRPLEEFAVDPLETLAAAREAELLGLELAGTWHSHVQGAPEPSARDRAEAVPGWQCVVVPVFGARGGMRERT